MDGCSDAERVLLLLDDVRRLQREAKQSAAMQSSDAHELRSRRTEIRELKNLIRDVVGQLNAERKVLLAEQKASAALSAERDALRDKVAALEKAARTERANAARRMRGTLRLKEHLRVSTEEHGEQVAALREQLRAQQAAAKRQLVAAQDELGRTSHVAQQAVEDADAARAELAGLKARWDGMEATVTNYQRDADYKLQNTDRLIAEANARATRAMAENAELRGAKKEVRDAHRAIAQLEAVNEERLVEKEVLYRSLREYEIRVEELRGINRQLRAELSHAQAQCSDERRRFRLEHLQAVDARAKHGSSVL